MKKDQLRQRVAYHEAGHAFAGLQLGFPFKHVSIVPTDDSLGNVFFRGLRLTDEQVLWMSSRTRDRLERRIIVCLAGQEGEWLVTGRYNHYGASEDYHHAIDMASRVTGSNEELVVYLKWLRIRATALIRSAVRRPMIDALVSALLTQEHIKGDVACQIMRDAMAAQVN